MVVVWPAMSTLFGCRQRGRLLGVVAALAAASMAVDARQAPSGRTVLVRAARIIDGRGGTPIRERRGADSRRSHRARRAGRRDDRGSGHRPRRAPRCSPGLIDLHTHLTDEVGTNWESALLTTTPGRAAIYGAVNARTTLLAGFTTAATWGRPGPTSTSTCATPSTRGRCPGRGCRSPATTCRRPAAPATRASSRSTWTCRSSAIWPTASIRCGRRSAPT